MTEEEIKQTKVLPRLLQRLGYRVLQLRREAVVRTGTSLLRADLVFCDKGNPYLVVETKAPDRINAESVLQAESYALLLHAPYFLVTDGSRWHWYRTGRDGGGSSEALDYEVLPRNRRSRFYLHEVAPAPPPALRTQTMAPAAPGSSGPPMLPQFVRSDGRIGPAGRLNDLHSGPGVRHQLSGISSGGSTPPAGQQRPPPAGYPHLRVHDLRKQAMTEQQADKRRSGPDLPAVPASNDRSPLKFLPLAPAVGDVRSLTDGDSSDDGGG